MIRRECYTPMTKHGGAIKGPVGKRRQARATVCPDAAAIVGTRPVCRPGRRNSSIQPKFPTAAAERSAWTNSAYVRRRARAWFRCCCRQGKEAGNSDSHGDCGAKHGLQKILPGARRPPRQAGMLSGLALRLSPVRLSLFYASVLSLRKLVLEEMDDRLREIRPFYPPIGGFGGIGGRGGEGEQWVEIVQFHDDFPAQCSSIEWTGNISTRHGTGKTPIRCIRPSLSVFVPLDFSAVSDGASP